MKRRAVAIALAVCLVVAPPAAAKTRSGCVPSGGRVMITYETGRLVEKIRQVRGTKVRQIYGCLFSTRRFTPIGSREESHTVVLGPGRSPVLAGRFLAYGQSYGQETPTGRPGINLVDLKLRRRIGGHEYFPGQSWDVTRLYARADGALAWSGHESAFGAPRPQVSKLDNPAFDDSPYRMMLDEGPDVLPQTLALSPDRTTLVWRWADHATGEGGKRTAALY